MKDAHECGILGSVLGSTTFWGSRAKEHLEVAGSYAEVVGTFVGHVYHMALGTDLERTVDRNRTTLRAVDWFAPVLIPLQELRHVFGRRDSRVVVGVAIEPEMDHSFF